MGFYISPTEFMFLDTKIEYKTGIKYAHSRQKRLKERILKWLFLGNFT